MSKLPVVSLGVQESVVPDALLDLRYEVSDGVVVGKRQDDCVVVCGPEYLRRVIAALNLVRGLTVKELEEDRYRVTVR